MCGELWTRCRHAEDAPDALRSQLRCLEQENGFWVDSENFGGLGDAVTLWLPMVAL